MKKTVIGAVILILWASGSANSSSKWNVLLITIDTLRADRLSCYGFSSVQTANIDRLAGRGTVFSRAFAHTPTTLPSHANILLGTTPLYHGVHENSNFVVRGELWTLAEHLKREGYSTAAFVGAYPLDSRFGLDQGFDVYDDDYGSQSARGASFFVERKAEAVVAKAIAWLAEYRRSSPWFLWVHCFDPHEPYNPPPPFSETFKNKPYDGEVAYVDHALGKLLVELEARDLLSRTIVILTGDHGESLGEHGEATHAYFAYNATLWVPLIICIPGVRSNSVDQYVSHIDLFPTLCDALGIKPPAGLPGLSLLPAMKGRKLRHRPIYFESLYPYYSRGWAPIRGVILDMKKYIDSPLPELYDLVKDFGENHNLADKERLDDYRKTLEAVMRAHSTPAASASRRAPDRETIQKLRSLGYVSGLEEPKESFNREDDVKILLPYHNRSMEARDLYREGNKERAKTILKAIIQDRKDIDVAYMNLATLYKEEGKMVEAIQVLKEGLTSLPTNYPIFSTYVNFLVASGQFNEVIAAISNASFRQMEYDPEIWNFLGIARASKGETKEALAAFEKSLAIDDKFSSSYVNRGMLFLAQFLESRDPSLAARAEEDFRRTIALDPGSAAAFNGQGVVCRLNGDFDQAVSHFLRAIELKPGYGDAVYNLGMAYFDKKDYARALRAFEDYRKKFGASLSQADRRKLDELIQECRRRL